MTWNCFALYLHFVDSQRSSILMRIEWPLFGGSQTTFNNASYYIKSVVDAPVKSTKAIWHDNIVSIHWLITLLLADNQQRTIAPWTEDKLLAWKIDHVLFIDSVLTSPYCSLPSKIKPQAVQYWKKCIMFILGTQKLQFLLISKTHCSHSMPPRESLTPQQETSARFFWEDLIYAYSQSVSKTAILGTQIWVEFLTRKP